MATQKLYNKIWSSKPGEILDLIRTEIRKAFGDTAENETRIFASHGYYRIYFPASINKTAIKDWEGLAIRRKSIPTLIDAIRKNANRKTA